MNAAAPLESGFFAPLEAASGAELALALQELLLAGKVLPVGAHLWVRHLFRSAETQPVEVVYSFALPRDAALRRFRVVGAGFSVESVLRPVTVAEEEYEEAVAQGHLASLVRNFRDGLVNLYLGNLKPGETVAVFLELVAGVELRDQAFRFRFPFTVAPSYHPQVRATEVAPGVGEMELPEQFEDLRLPVWVQNAQGLHQVGFSLELWLPEGAWELDSPSHRVQVGVKRKDLAQVRLAVDQEVPNRDLVLELRTQAPIQGVFGGPKDKGKSLAVVLPSSFFGEQQQTQPKDVVFVLDCSGSMEGKSLEQAKKAFQACLAALRPEDRFGLVAFASGATKFSQRLMPASPENRRKAEQFLGDLEAGGGTELQLGLSAAAELLPQGGDVLLLTDGQVFGTESIVAHVRGTGMRIHCLGIGAASQDRFLTSLAQASGGVSRFLTPREQVPQGALELLASICSPVARELTVEAPEAEVTPRVQRTVFAGQPVVLFAFWEGEEGALALSWKSGQGFQRRTLALETTTDGLGETVYLLEGAKRITELESQAEELTPGVRRELEELGQRYGLANRALALVAVVARPGDRPGEPPKTMVVPVGMPEDTPFGAYFDFSRREAVESPALCLRDSALSVIRDRADYKLIGELPTDVEEELPTDEEEELPRDEEEEELPTPGSLASFKDFEQRLSSLARRLNSDVGILGLDEEEHWLISAVVLLLLAYKGHNQEGKELYPSYRMLLDLLKKHPATLASFRQAELVARLEAGEVFEGPWEELAEDWFAGKRIEPSRFWGSLPIP